MSEAGGAGALSPRVRAVLAAGLTGLLLGFLWGIADVPRFTAVATVLVSGQDGAPAKGAELGAAVELARSAEVAEHAARLIGGDVGGADLLSEIEATADPEAGAVRIAAGAESPDFAAAAANGYGLALVEVGGKRFEQGSAATIPGSPSENRPAPLWALLGLLAGLLAGVLAVFARDRSAARRRHAEPRRAADSPPTGAAATSVAVLARCAGPDRLVKLADGAVTVDRVASRHLADQLGIGAGGDAPRLIVAVDVAEGDGGGEVLAGLAAIAAERNLRAILIEADLARPVLAARLGVLPSPGLTDYLRGVAGPRDVLRRMPFEDGAALVCVPAGAPSGERIGGERFAALMQRLARAYDLVLVAAGSDQVDAIAALSDGVLLVTAGDENAGRRLDLAAGSIRRAHLLGAVITGSGPAQAGRQGAPGRHRE